MALIADVVNNDTVDGAAHGGVYHSEVRAIFDSTKGMTTGDVGSA